MPTRVRRSQITEFTFSLSFAANLAACAPASQPDVVAPMSSQPRGPADDPREIEQQEPGNKGPRTLGATHPSPLTIPVGTGSSIVVEIQFDHPRIALRDPGFATLVITSSGPPLEVEMELPDSNGGYRTTSVRAAFRFADGAVYPQQVGEVQSTPHLEWRSIGPEARRRLNLASWDTHVALGHAFLRIDTYLRARVDPNGPWQSIPVSVETPVDIDAATTALHTPSAVSRFSSND